MTTFVVTTLADENDPGATEAAPGGGGLSLREAVALANAAAGTDAIAFDESLAGVIRLTSGVLAITQGLAIDGGGRITVTGDTLANDVTGPGGITDVAASAGLLGDNVRLFDIGANADVTFQDLVLTGGHSAGNNEGGGAVRSQSDVWFSGATLAGNSTGGDYSGGGAIAGASGVTMSGCLVAGNATTGNSAPGGGISGGTVVVTASTVSGNWTASPYGPGGGIYAGLVQLDGVTVEGNSTLGTRSDGGGVFGNTVSIANGTIAGNATAGDYSRGGGLFGRSAVILASSTVTGNATAGIYADGGGIFVDAVNASPYGYLALTDSIVLGNRSAQAGSAEYGVVPYDLRLAGGNILGAAVYAGTVQVGVTAAADVFASVIDIGGGILAGVVAANGGPVRTVALNAAPANPALDASGASASAADARGAARLDQAGIANANGGAADLGAFEVNPPVASPDAVTASEDAVLSGTVFGANGGQADSGFPLAVAAVNGSAAAVGNTVTLASGAHLTLRADGSFDYDPAGAFDALPDFAASGASNTVAGDSFTYTLAGGGSATVTVSIRGVDSSDVLLGTPGNDTLDGGAGTDRMTGGLGDDTYRIDVKADRTIEAPGGGTDTVVSIIGRTLGANLENLILEGAAVTGNGNGLDNAITGNGLGNRLQGALGNDTLAGGGGDDELRGAGGSDSMTGGPGNDRYFVDNTGDTVHETAPAEGNNDTVYSQIGYTLGPNIENLRLQTVADLAGAGNGLANRIAGNKGANLLQGLGGADRIEGGEGADTLAGGEGNDTLTGGSQADVFRFAASGAGADRIEDFNRNADRFQLSGGTFTNLQIAGADTILTHGGGTIRVVGVSNLTLGQWTALIVPGGEGGGGLLPFAAGDAAAGPAAQAAHAQNDLFHFGPGDWFLA